MKRGCNIFAIMNAELDPETMLLWNEYLSAERVRVRQESLLALERFSEALLRLAPEVWQPWARELAMGVVD